MSAACNPPVNLYLAISARRHRRSVVAGKLPTQQECAALGEQSAHVSLLARADTCLCARTRTHALRAKVTQPCPALDHSSVPNVQRLCAGFHASPDSLMGAARSRHSILSAHTWARAAFAGTGLRLPASRSSAPGSGRPPGAMQPVFEPLLCSGPVARSVITRRRAYSGARCSPSPARPSRTDGLPSLGADTLSGPPSSWSSR